jgi:hypothetical protein
MLDRLNEPTAKCADRDARFPKEIDVSATLVWKGRSICRPGSRRPIVTIEPDGQYPDMWRLRLPSGRVTDMVNLSRAKDEARAIAGRLVS